MMLSKKLKLFIKRSIRFNKDLIQGNLFQFATKRKREIYFKSVISISQEIKPSETFDNKIFNLSLASKRINAYCIMPNEIFSFWRIIGNPSYEFKKGRALLNGQIKEEAGGGICQVSGIVYNICLIAGLHILERYNHSVDIYTEETRFSPLGLDATVVYGYKDLRFRNNFNFPIKFQIEIIKNIIKIDLLSTQNIKEVKLILESEFDDQCILVNVFDENRKLLNSSRYCNYIS